MADMLDYGEQSLESRYAVSIFDYVQKLRDRLDERAFVECLSIPKDDRLRIYYGGRDEILPLLEEVRSLLGMGKKQPDFSATEPEGTQSLADSKPLGPITQTVADIENALEGAGDAAILMAVLAKLTPMRNEAVHADGGYGNDIPTARETDDADQMVNLEEGLSGDRDDIEQEPPTTREQLVTPDKSRRIRARDTKSND